MIKTIFQVACRTLTVCFTKLNLIKFVKSLMEKRVGCKRLFEHENNVSGKKYPIKYEVKNMESI